MQRESVASGGLSLEATWRYRMICQPLLRGLKGKGSDVLTFTMFHICEFITTGFSVGAGNFVLGGLDISLAQMEMPTGAVFG